MLPACLQPALLVFSPAGLPCAALLFTAGFAVKSADDVGTSGCKEGEKEPENAGASGCFLLSALPFCCGNGTLSSPEPR